MIELQHVSKAYKGKQVLSGIDLLIHTGELMVLIGSSGCGKTTLLKMINKLNAIDSGDILIDGVSVKKISDTRLRRQIGYVVQEGGLFAHLTVEENISLVLKITGVPKADHAARVSELLEMVNLNPEEYRGLFPCQLSGGQRQRVGVARAFAANPDIILMDEPFSALDPVTRAELQDEVAGLQKQFKKTIVFVTHDMDEAVKLANRICIIQNGRIVQCDSPEMVLKQPANSYVEEFVGKNRIWGNPEYIKARDIMKKNPVCISRTRSVLQALQTMNHYVIDSVLVTENKKLEGVVWLEDLREFQDYRAPVSEFLSNDFVTVHEDTTLQKIIDTIDYNASGIIPVVDEDNHVTGYLTKSSLLATLSKRYESPDATQERSAVL
ncbi:ABC transporter ATP-binding protein [Feifania hominis]|uniref:Quaternary amine transport ATP-binding protein n=1 Tax=Feifania hominis TaxID=2763660 RepID=A0A926HU81_9FIRM|nr:ABC transporter ATP-binding protein [Feifania hominis]MBC8535266.1 ABC transporter ATP-binding protein [Feifania hominis]